MGATSMNLPAIFLPAGPMLRGNWQGKVLGSGSDAWKYWDERRAGKITDARLARRSRAASRARYGTCMTMGTAATMTAIAEAIGMTLPGASSIPAADAGHIRMAAECGRRIVEMVWEDLTPRDDPDARGVRERDHGRDGDGLLDQRDHPPDRAWRAAPARTSALDDFETRQPQGAGDRQHAPERRQVPDGGFLLRRRPAGADEPHPRAPASRRA